MEKYGTISNLIKSGTIPFDCLCLCLNILIKIEYLTVKSNKNYNNF